jgi:hypothetical protein
VSFWNENELKFLNLEEENENKRSGIESSVGEEKTSKNSLEKLKKKGLFVDVVKFPFEISFPSFSNSYDIITPKKDKTQ